MSVRSDIETGFQSPTRLQGDIQSSIRWSIWVLLPHTMGKSLVQIENEKLLYTFLGELEINLSSKYFIFCFALLVSLQIYTTACARYFNRLLRHLCLYAEGVRRQSLLLSQGSHVASKPTI